MVSSQNSRLRSTQDGNLVSLLVRREANCDTNVIHFTRFPFGMSPDMIMTFKVRVLTSDFKFRIGVHGYQ